MSDHDTDVNPTKLRVLRDKAHRTLVYLNNQISTTPHLPDTTKQFYLDLLFNLNEQVEDLYTAKLQGA